MSETINTQRLPTPSDLVILNWLDQGQSINNAEAITRFNNACLRDAIWRLGNAGHTINREWVHYINRHGKKKKYKSYFIRKPEIIPNGQIVENEYKKGTKTATDFAVEILQGTTTVQNPIFERNDTSNNWESY